jgi:hypothetical protein
MNTSSVGRDSSEFQLESQHLQHGLPKYLLSLGVNGEEGCCKVGKAQRTSLHKEKAVRVFCGKFQSFSP